MNIIDIDLFILKFFYIQNTALDYFLIILQYLLYISILGFLYYYFKKNRETFYHLILTLAVGLFIVFVIKTTVDRPRPYSEFPAVIHSVVSESDASFPSNHSFVSFLLLSFVPVSIKKLYKYLIYIYLLFIPFSMMIVGLHYPTDVLAGALIGIVLPRILTKKFSVRIFKFFLKYF